jgi:hypothetical protein
MTSYRNNSWLRRVRKLPMAPALPYFVPAIFAVAFSKSLNFISRPDEDFLTFLPRRASTYPTMVENDQLSQSGRHDPTLCSGGEGG